ncbi:UNVERIFIED_CONTAM: Cytochrome P450 2J2 [Trichonephila clavipes]
MTQAEFSKKSAMPINWESFTETGNWNYKWNVIFENNFFSPYAEEVLEDMVGTFFGAGSETVRLTVDWLALTMAAYPEVQKKVQAEIDNVVGRERMPSWDEHEKLPYTEAVIMELMRWRTIIPINVLRYTLWDTTLNGYFIPKDSVVVANLWSVHHNPKYWGADAETFRPERFLTKDGKQVVKSEYFIPFSIGE